MGTATTKAPDVIPCAHIKIGDSVGHIMFGGPVYRIQGETGRAFTFEWHPYFGPSRCHSVTGELCKNEFFPERSGFWPLFERWMAGGKQVDQFQRCVLAPPPPACDATCSDCGGRGWFRYAGDSRKFACHGAPNRVALKPREDA